jgi:hypothetical protein
MTKETVVLTLTPTLFLSIPATSVVIFIDKGHNDYKLPAVASGLAVKNNSTILSMTAISR